MNNGTPALTKDELRRSMKAALRAVPSAQRAAWSSDIRLRLQTDSSWVPRRGSVVAMFGGMATEPDLLPLMPWLTEQGLQVAFFSIEEGNMTPRLVRQPSELCAGQLGVLEPDRSASAAVDVKKLDVVFLPGLAFNPTNGARLGRGKGYYDRVLAALPATSVCIGICFHLQLHEAVPLEWHDRHVRAVVTEKEWLRVAS